MKEENSESKKNVEKLLGRLDELVSKERDISEMILDMKAEVDKIHSNVEFYKESLEGSDAILETMKEGVKRGVGEMGVLVLADILTGTLVRFERKGLIKIIRK